VSCATGFGVSEDALHFRIAPSRFIDACRHPATESGVSRGHVRSSVDDIEEMPMGMHTRIARALVLKPSILIFDEATSALDNRTQAIVAASLKRLKATRILVAHRLGTLKSADRIYVIEKAPGCPAGQLQPACQGEGPLRAHRSVFAVIN
jgi:ABC-type nitrate/sulfonate/bicarbonate transport system ATPase subunit